MDINIDGVGFNIEAIKSMTEDEFISKHFPTCRTDLPENTRKKWLVMVYGKITGKEKRETKTVDADN